MTYLVLLQCRGGERPFNLCEGGLQSRLDFVQSMEEFNFGWKVPKISLLAKLSWTICYEKEKKTAMNWKKNSEKFIDIRRRTRSFLNQRDWMTEVTWLNTGGQLVSTHYHRIFAQNMLTCVSAKNNAPFQNFAPNIPSYIHKKDLVWR